jgi:hypothetical protein
MWWAKGRCSVYSLQAIGASGFTVLWTYIFAINSRINLDIYIVYVFLNKLKVLLQLRDGEMRGLHSLARSSEAEGNTDHITDTDTGTYRTHMENMFRVHCSLGFRGRRSLGFREQRSLGFRERRTLGFSEQRGWGFRERRS